MNNRERRAGLPQCNLARCKEMKYRVNGQEMDRKTLVQKVLEVVKDLPTEKQPPMAKRELYPIEHNVKNHACGIARAMGWDVEVV